MANFNNELRNYQVLPRELIFDNSLTDRARFVYCYMAAKPDGWDFYLEPMARELGYGKDTLRKYMKELIDRGWLERGEQKHLERKKFGSVTYTLKAIAPCMTFTDTVNYRHGDLPTRSFTDTEKVTHIENKDNIENKDTLKKREAETQKSKGFDLSFVSPEYQDIFSEWLEYKHDIKDSYKSPKSLKACYNKLLKLSDNNPETARQIVEQSMANNWKGLFALKDETNRRTYRDSKQEANDYAMQQFFNRCKAAEEGLLDETEHPF